MSARVFPATLAAATQAQAWADAECERLALGADAGFALSLWLEELFVNAVQHGGAQEIRLTLSREGLQFCDDGAAFDPTRAPAKRLEGPSMDFEVGGFGLGLVQTFAGRFGYRRSDGWNVTTLAFSPVPR